MSDALAIAVATTVVVAIAAAVTYRIARLDLTPSGALLATACAAVAVGTGWLLTLFHALLGFTVGLVIYLIARTRLPAPQAMLTAGAAYALSTLLSVAALMVALSGM
ncbi:hypothetical protein C6Y14_42120 [Streptomyces dioscori]|uniref:Uncharacterized protein n=1 Tax=Streptomyces dioscori TaxID=2109333 RepID=A0A2P8PTZ2_9ACTN|nr:hypothetical protein [Streptomyces dioscori]PSM37470.1 hypothetical protein C6Y14_42120 [Streptomyces dioscori]